MTQRRIRIKDIIVSLQQLPKIISVILQVEKKDFFLIIFLSVITGIFPAVTLILSQELINSFIKGKDFVNSTIIIFAIYIIVLYIGELIQEAKGYVEGKFQYLLQYRLNYIILEKCTSLSLKDFESSAVYDKIEKITGEISYRPFHIFLAIINLLTSVITLIASAWILFSWNPYVSTIMLLVPVVSLLYFLRIGQHEFDVIWNRAKDERKTWYLSYLLTHDFSYKEVIVLGVKDYLLNKYIKLSNGFVGQNIDILKKKTKFDIAYESIMQSISALIIGMALFSAYVGEILVGNIISYIRSVGLIQSSSQQMIANIYNIYNSSLYMEMLFEFLKLCEQKADDDSQKAPVPDEFSTISIKNLSFSYKNEKRVLNNINISLNKGEKIALVGPNGSGKSTLIKILLGLYEAEEGQIYIDNMPLTQANLKEYLSKVSVLFQDFVKYELTLQENVGFGDIMNFNSKDKIVQTLDNLQADFLKIDGRYALDMQLGNWFEDGRQLSQGQWQKIALARAYFKEAEVYILDEPNAALDTVSEREIFNRFFEISKEKIGIFISHRLNAAKLADKIIVMRDGEIVGIGKHDELIEKCVAYQELYQAELYEKDR